MPSGGARRGTGAKPKPRELKALEGTYIPPAKRAAPPPAVVGGFPAPPDDLSEAEAKLWATFPKPAWIGETDVVAVRAAVSIYARILQVQPAARLGELRDIEQESKLWGRLMSVLASLGLTPADRSKMQIPSTGDTGDKWEGLLN
jgi:hypothetical protein